MQNPRAGSDWYSRTKPNFPVPVVSAYPPPPVLPPPPEIIPETPPSRGTVKCFLLSFSMVLLLVLTGTALILLFSNFSTDRAKHETLTSELGSISTTNIHILYFRFQTGTELQLPERHPELGTLDGLNLTNVLDYSVCCNTLSHQFVCLGGSSLTYGGGSALEALLQEQNDEVFLLLWLNSRDLIEVGCIMRAIVTGE